MNPSIRLEYQISPDYWMPEKKILLLGEEIGQSFFAYWILVQEPRSFWIFILRISIP
jgi:hypothetical protein